ncbi:MAG: hypothetical protein CMF22_10360 [Idiomarinaceae bacterium]|nr:hypothetical protein [Idiomarinaceae bacterium]MBG23843.1 hypothetical protein [Idiomarinaceae bacterium]|tara:strand:+ start:22994 stop:23263 length:270 start_codon:yes stop_codon:yes gene_type:complete
MTISNTARIRRIIEQADGRFFTATFVKKDGSVRKMNCRTGVMKYVKGTGRPTHNIGNLVAVYDVKVKGYRFINLKTLSKIKIDGMTITV